LKMLHSRRDNIIDERLEEGKSRKIDLASDADENGSQEISSELPFIAGNVYIPPPAIQTSESSKPVELVLLLLENIDVSLRKLVFAVQNSESPESAELVLLLLENIVDVSFRKLVQIPESPESAELVLFLLDEKCEEKDGKEDRRCLVFSRGVLCIETGRGRRLVVSEKVVLGVKEGVSAWDAVSDCLRPRFVNARNPDLKKSE